MTPMMNRRTFAQSLVAGALSAAVPSLPAAAQTSTSSTKTTPFPLSVMLWTVFTDLPFDQRLAKIAEAGYNQVELVGEYSKWTPAEFSSANAIRKHLGINFDTTAGLAYGIANPASRDAFLADLTKALKPMETLGCPSIIVLTGDTVPSLTYGEQLDSCVETLKQASAVIENRTIDGKPVRLLLECIDPEENPNYFLASAGEAIEVIRKVKHPQVQFLYDIYHEQVTEGNLIEKLNKHLDVIGLIHVADVPGRHQPGTGEINYENIFRRLVELNYGHNVAMEFLPTGDQVAALKGAKEMAMRAVKA